MYTSFTHHWHMIYTSFTHHLHVVYTPCTRHLHIIDTWFTHHLHVVYTSCTRRLHIIDTFFTHHLHVVYTSFTYDLRSATSGIPGSGFGFFVDAKGGCQAFDNTCFLFVKFLSHIELASLTDAACIISDFPTPQDGITYNCV
jgi:hypothetical protein